MEFTTLNNGVKMPLENFGVFQVPDAAVCRQAVTDAISSGYRLIDTAVAYMNETIESNSGSQSGGTSPIFPAGRCPPEYDTKNISNRISIFGISASMQTICRKFLLLTLVTTKLSIMPTRILSR